MCRHRCGQWNDAHDVQLKQWLPQLQRVRTPRALGGQLLSLGEPFLGELTLGQYLELPDDERSQLWDVWAEIETEELEELDVHPDAMPTR